MATAESTVIKPEHDAQRGAPDLHAGAPRPARLDERVGQEGDAPAPERVGGHLLADRGHEARGRPRLPGLCFPEEYGGQGGDYYYSLIRAECLSLLGLGRDQHGLRGPDRHGPPSRPHAGHRGAEAALPRARASRATRSAASASPSRARAPTSRASARPRSATATSTSSTARRRSSRTGRAPTSASWSRRPTPTRATPASR